MKTLLYLNALIFGLAVSVSSCKSESDDPAPVVAAPQAELPTPQAAFGQNRYFIERNETVTFSNFSLNATRYEWDFGNGQTSAQPNPTIFYTYPGEFVVTLTAYNADNKSTTVTGRVKVGRGRILKGVNILNVNFQNPAGQPWDLDGTGPDVWLHFKPGVWASFLTNTFNNIAPSDLPLNWTPAGNGSIPLGNQVGDEIWTFTLYETNNGGWGDKVIHAWTLNPSGIGVKNYIDGTGVITLTDSLNKNKIEVLFEVY